MARYRIHRMKDTPRENFRWAAHTSGLAIVKQRDYEPSEELEADTPYAAWKLLQSENRDLHPGDILETCLAVPGHEFLPVHDATPGREAAHSVVTSGPLLILKYIGFEPAAWYVPPVKLDQNLSSASDIDLVAASLPAENVTR
jgi:hypothetical protein